MYAKKYANDAAKKTYNNKKTAPVKSAYVEKLDKVAVDKIIEYTPSNIMIMGSIPEARLQEAKTIAAATIERIGHEFGLPEPVFYINTIRKRDGTFALTIFIKDKRYVNLFLNKGPKGESLVEYVYKAYDKQKQDDIIAALAEQMSNLRDGYESEESYISWYDMWADITEVVPAKPHKHYTALRESIVGRPSLFGNKVQKDINYNTVNFFTNFELTKDEMSFFSDVTRPGYPRVNIFPSNNTLGCHQYVLEYPEGTTDGLDAWIFYQKFEIMRNGKAIKLFLNPSK